MARLSDHQIYILKQLASGQEIAFSQDGETAWFWPADDFLTLPMEIALPALRELRLIGPDPNFDEDTAGRFGPSDVITEAGQTALKEAERG